MWIQERKVLCVKMRGMERFSLDLLRVVKKKNCLGSGVWGSVEFVVSVPNFFLTLWFEVGASNGKSSLWWSVNVVCVDCSWLNPRAWGDYLSSQLERVLSIHQIYSVHLVDELVLVFYTPFWLAWLGYWSFCSCSFGGWWTGEYGFSTLEKMLFWEMGVEFKGRVISNYPREVEWQQGIVTGIGFCVYNVLGYPR